MKTIMCLISAFLVIFSLVPAYAADRRVIRETETYEVPVSSSATTTQTTTTTSRERSEPSSSQTVVYESEPVTSTTVVERRPVQRTVVVEQPVTRTYHTTRCGHFDCAYDDCDHDGDVGLLGAIGEVLSFPFKLVGGVIDGLF